MVSSPSPLPSSLSPFPMFPTLSSSFPMEMNEEDRRMRNVGTRAQPGKPQGGHSKSRPAWVDASQECAASLRDARHSDDSCRLRQGREHLFDPDGEGGDARGGVRLRSKWKGHGAWSNQVMEELRSARVRE